MVSPLKDIRFYPYSTCLVGSESMSMNYRWEKNSQPIVGFEGHENTFNELRGPCALVVDPSHDMIYIADTLNHRIFAWNEREGKGYIVAGGNGPGSGLNQLNKPTDVSLDTEAQSLLICDSGNKRVMRWSLKETSTQGEIVIEDIWCHGLAMDKDKNLYITDVKNHEVRRYLQSGGKQMTTVAGGHGKGHAFNQLHNPLYVAVDHQDHVYVSDSGNHRVMKWNTKAKAGKMVAGNGQKGNTLKNLYCPGGIVVDKDGIIYVVETENHRVTRWYQGNEQSEIIAGGNGKGTEPNQLFSPIGIAFDKEQKLYVADGSNAILCFKKETVSYVKSETNDHDHDYFVT